MARNNKRCMYKTRNQQKWFKQICIYRKYGYDIISIHSFTFCWLDGEISDHDGDDPDTQSTTGSKTIVRGMLGSIFLGCSWNVSVESTIPSLNSIEDIPNTLLGTNINFLHQLMRSFSHYLQVYTSQVVQDFFHQQYPQTTSILLWFASIFFDSWTTKTQWAIFSKWWWIMVVQEKKETCRPILPFFSEPLSPQVSCHEWPLGKNIQTLRRQSPPPGCVFPRKKTEPWPWLLQSCGQTDRFGRAAGIFIPK